MKSKALIVGIIVAMSLSMATQASAIVYRITDGSADWFVGKGDVQSAFGWDAKTTDTNFDKVYFTYKKTEVTTYLCMDNYRGTKTYSSELTATNGTTRQTAYETRKAKGGGTVTSVTGAFVTLSGIPTFTGSSPECTDPAYPMLDASSKSTVTTLYLFASLTTTVTSRKGTVTTTDTRQIWTEVK